MKKKNALLALTLALGMTVSLTACGSGGDSETDGSNGGGDSATSTVANKDKPLVWFNRQPSNSSTGELDKAALSFNDNTYYVGFDAKQGAEVQGTMIKDYIEKNIDSIDRNGDGIIGYVLAIGDVGHNDSIARTRGVREALGTGVEGDGGIVSEPIGTNVDGKAKSVQDGTLEVNGKSYKIRELASQEMKNNSGATWDAATAGNAIGTWASSFDEQIDVIASNNDGMGMSIFNSWSKDNKVPTFGYDANSDAVAAIAEGYGGTVSQHADVQAYLTLRVLRNALDGVDIDTGIGTEDEAGNVLGEDAYVYKEDERSYYALNVAVTAENYKDFTDSTKVYEPVSKQLDASKSPEKKVWLNIYNSSDNFLGSTYQPLLEAYDDLLNLKVEYIAGDGQTESNITNRLGNPSEYDAFAINMVKTDNGASYTSLLNQ
ncbi:substrate-binding domain-containing protein [Enterococcus asini]|uniref:substrate-binding domain-containing protein n=1 Tax=Enterococcus TaxID=1350 RepID=UPI00288DA753|nr:substrate-binding domain-containing protein [Enterococcus asini]MDT2758017.1 substrate-binding domain-containing protein [Enterococcus asini]